MAAVQMHGLIPLKLGLYRGGSRVGGGGGGGLGGVLPFGGPHNFKKRGKRRAGMRHVLVLNSYPDTPPRVRR